MSIVTTTLVAILVYSFVRWVTKTFNHYRRPKGFPPGPRKWPVIGSVPYLPKELRNKQGLHVPKVFKHMAETYGSISGLYLGPQKTIVVSDVADVKEILRMPQMIGRQGLFISDFCKKKHTLLLLIILSLDN